MNGLRSHSCRRPQPSGYTLLELVVASASAAVLVGGLTSALFIASQTLDVSSGSLVQTRKANEALATITNDLQSALSLTELTDTAVTMTVPDRDGDNIPETIRYYWSGMGNSPLRQTYNGTTTDLATNVQSFSLTWLTRFIEGVNSNPVILFVSGQYADGDGGLGTPTAAEQDRIDIMEGWGYSVTVISQEATQEEFDEAMSEATVVFVSGSGNPVTLGTKLNDTRIGVVTESFYNAATLGFYSSGSAYTMSGTSIEITDNSHFITTSFSLGTLEVVTSAQVLKWTNAPTSDEATTLADVHSALPYPTLLTLDTDDLLAAGGVSPGRRVQLPWGESGFDATTLTVDGKTLLQRSLEWAAGSNEGTARPLLLLVGDAASPTSAETARQELIASWGYDVSLATAGEDQSVYNTYPDSYDVVYVPSSVNASDVGDKLNDLGIGVVNEEPDLTSNLGFTSDTSGFFATETNITDNTHEITLPYSTGNLKISDIALFGSLRQFTGSIGTGVQALSTRTSTSDRMIMTLDAGAALFGGGTAPARRVMLPWGISNSFDVSDDLTDAGRTIMHRAIDWAADTPEISGVVFEEFTEDRLTSNGTSLTIATPAGVAEGDLLVAAVATDGPPSITLTGPAGWTRIGAMESSSSVSLAVWWKLAAASESSNHEFTWDGGERAYGWIMRFTGHNASDPINAVAMEVGSSSSPVSPEVTSTVANAMILRLGGFDDDDVTIDDPGLPGHTAITMDENDSGAGTCSGGAGYVNQAAAGASGTSNFALTASEQYVTITIAIAPEESP